MYNKELEEIIDAALADGVLTDKEREVLHKKAVVFGVDPNELDVVVEGRLQKMQHEVDAAKQKVRKCPSCGEIIPAMSAVCPTCGQVIDTSNADNKALSNFMSQLEKKLVELKEGGFKKYNRKVKAELEGMVRQGKAMYDGNKKITCLIGEVEFSIKKFEALRRRVILGIAVLVVVIVGLAGYGYNNAKVQEAAETKAFMEQVDEQAKTIKNVVAGLPIPNKSNYDECVAVIRKLNWKEIPTGESLFSFDRPRATYQNDAKDATLLLINNYIKQLQSVEMPYIDKLTGKPTSENDYHVPNSDGSSRYVENDRNPKYVEELHSSDF